MKRALVVLSLCGALPLSLPQGTIPFSGTLCAQDLFPEVSARRQAAIDRARKRVSEAINASRRASDARAREILSAARAELRRDADLPDSVLGDLDRSITRELDILGQASGAPPILPIPNPGASPSSGQGSGPGSGPKPGALLPPPNRDRAQMDEEGLWNDRRRKVEDDAKLGEKREKAFGGQLDGVERAATPPKDDVTGPSLERQKIIASRTSMDGHPTPAEKTIMRKLSQPLGKDMDKVPLDDFFKYLGDKHGIEVLFSQADLEAQNSGVLSADTPKISGRLSVRSAIRMVVAKYNLSYWIVDEGIEVVSQEKARTTMLTKTYYVGDLAAVFQPPTWNYQIWRNAWGNPVVVYGPNPAGTPVGQQLIMRQNIEALMQMITGIDPQAFGSNGQARISYHPATMSLIIKATAEDHQKIMGGGK